MCTMAVIIISLLITSACAVPRFAWMVDADGRPHLVDAAVAESQEAASLASDFDGERDVALKLYTRNNPSSPEIIKISDDSTSPSFNPQHPTRFIIHGWTSNSDRLNNFREAYMSTGLPLNVVMVDWSGPASHSYLASKTLSRLVGQHLADTVGHLAIARGLVLEDTHVIGHSLGAQVAAVTGHELGGRLARIVGLDAAAPLFWGAALSRRLDASDAVHVVAVHTNGGEAGWLNPLGHADFFPNGGRTQAHAGCGLDLVGKCSHNRALHLYVESITSKYLLGTLCDSYKEYRNGSCNSNLKAVMGEWTPLGLVGNFYLKTNSEPPFGLGDIDL